MRETQPVVLISQLQKEDVMLCPYCSHAETRVADKRDAEGVTRRRRECLKCEKRFSTRETVERSELKVIKKDARRELFDRNKVVAGIQRACEKRAVSDDQIEKMVNRIEERIRKKGKEIKTSVIGEMVSQELRKVDKVAYIRFASVYRDFTDISDFKKEIKTLLNN